MPQPVPSTAAAAAAAPLSYAGPSPINDDPAVMHVTANQHNSVKAGSTPSDKLGAGTVDGSFGARAPVMDLGVSGSSSSNAMQSQFYSNSNYHSNLSREPTYEAAPSSNSSSLIKSPTGGLGSDGGVGSGVGNVGSVGSVGD